MKRKPKRSDYVGPRKRITLRLTMPVWKVTSGVARRADMSINDLIESILQYWNGREPPVSK